VYEIGDIFDTSAWLAKWFRSCDRNSDSFKESFCDLILMEVLESNGIVRFIVRSVLSSFALANVLPIIEIDAD
jgi:hypothetical protein